MVALLKRVWILAFALILVACGADAGDADSQSQLPSSTSDGQAIEVETSTTLDLEEFTADTVPEPDYQAIVEAAQADLAERLNTSPDEIEVESVESGIWNDGSVGCPEDGAIYTQAIVVGSRIVLAHGSDTFEYHQSGDEPAFLCVEPAADAFKGQEGDVLLPPPRYDD